MADSGAPEEDAATPPAEDAATPLQDAATPPEDAATPPQDAGTPPQDAATLPEDAAIPAPDAATPPPAASFEGVYAIFTDAACADCHGGDSPPQGLNLETIDTAYANLVGVAARECTTGRLRVAAGDSSASYLINKLTGLDMCSGQRMPRGGPFLDDGAINFVRAWIDSGAER